MSTQPNFNPNRPPCRFFNTGKGCQNGDQCRFVHNRPKTKPAAARQQSDSSYEYQEDADQYFDEKGNPRRPPPPQPQIVQYAVVSPRIPMPPHQHHQPFHIIPAAAGAPVAASAPPHAINQHPLSPRSPLETLYITEQDLDKEGNREYGTRIRNCRYFHTRVGCKNGTNCKFAHSNESYYNPYEEEELAQQLYDDGSQAFEEEFYEDEEYYEEEGAQPAYDDQNNNQPTNEHAGAGSGRKRTVCRFFYSRQGCKNGQSCPFDHTEQEAPRGGPGQRYKSENKQPPRRSHPAPPPRQQQQARERHLSWREDAPPEVEAPQRRTSKPKTSAEQRSPKGSGPRDEEFERSGGDGSGGGRNRIACRFFNSRRGCERGEECHFAHADRRRRKFENDRSSAEDDSQEQAYTQLDEERPMRICRWFTTKKGCRKGNECDFAHEHPDNSKNSLNSVTEETTDNILNQVIDSTDKISLDASTAAAEQ